MRAKPEVIDLIRSHRPELTERELYRLATDELAGLLSAAKSHWTISKVDGVWGFAPTSNVKPLLKCTNDGLKFINRKDFAT